MLLIKSPKFIIIFQIRKKKNYNFNYILAKTSLTIVFYVCVCVTKTCSNYLITTLGLSLPPFSISFLIIFFLRFLLNELLVPAACSAFRKFSQRLFTWSNGIATFFHLVNHLIQPLGLVTRRQTKPVARTHTHTHTAFLLIAKHLIIISL